MDIDEENERLEAIVARFFTPQPRTILGTAQAPFDTSKPNIHDTKADFLLEKSTVDKAFKDAKALLDFLLSRYREENEDHEVVKSALQFVDLSAKRSQNRESLETIPDLIRKNAVETGLSHNLTFLLLDLVTELAKRKQELDSQESVFWKSKGRSPNHYARTIALRFAKLIARETGKKPTFGTSSDGTHPSTEFGRALEEVFEVLEIKANVRHPAKWAIDQITDEDLQPEPVNQLAYGGMGSLFGAPPPENALAKITNALAKGS